MKLLMMILTFTLISCGKTKTTKIFKTNALPEAYSYSFYEDNCETGEHKFYRLAEACEALLNEELNNFCAFEDRENLYLSTCNDVLEIWEE